ncbi:MAG: DNA-binding response regulator [Bacteroidetes bacterium GWA2_32_17]|nr:MAG: DNA-binding response regulator [Bacteroidetes bacterium GWA2_32_17]
MKILLIEDEENLSSSIIDYLILDGYVCETCTTFEMALEKINLYNYDCIVVDIMLPDGNGLDIIKKLKSTNKATGIIIISAKKSLDDKIIGLEIGADDYLTKPFNISELNARIKSIIRRRNFNGKNEIIFNEIKVFPDQLKVVINETELILTKKEYNLLVYFMSNKDRFVTKESIAEHLWGDEMDMANSFDFIYSHIKNLRKKIIVLGGNDYIKTVYGIGYKFTDSI